MKPLRFLSPLHKATRQLSVHLQRLNAGLGVSNPEAHLLAYLRSYGPCPISELLRILGHRKSTMTSILDRLADRSLVTREINPADRRSFLIGLTAAGTAVAEQVRQIIEELEEQLDGQITAQDLTGFQNVMGAIAKVTAVELRKTGPPSPTEQQGVNES
jgi:DNA-binding MarR family transcriptional regulator